MGRGSRHALPLPSTGEDSGGPQVIDLSTWTVDADPDSIIAARTASEVTLNQSSSFDPANNARLLGPELADGESVTFVMEYAGRNAAGKDFLMLGVYDDGSGEGLGAGLNAAGGGTTDMAWLQGGAHDFPTTPTTQARWRVSFHRVGTTVYKTMTAYLCDSDGGNPITIAKTDTSFTLTGTLYLAAFLGINSSAGGTVGPNAYSGTYTVAS